MKFDKIKLGFCVAYDWEFLKDSLPLVYKSADIICLALDKDTISWAGNHFNFDREAFLRFVAEVDKQNKIKILEEDFHLPSLAPMENEVRQRKLMAEFLGDQDGWHIQLDSDEYFLDFDGFVRYLKQLNPKRTMNVCCPWITLYKRVDEGFLMVNAQEFERVEFIPVATSKPHYEHGRRNGYFNHYANFPILHQSWARSKEEVWQKLNNWGHRYDSDIESYFKKWEAVSVHNYKEYINFNQTTPEAWPSLALLPLDKNSTVSDLISRGVSLPAKISKADLRRKNSILWSYFHTLIHKLKGK